MYECDTDHGAYLYGTKTGLRVRKLTLLACVHKERRFFSAVSTIIMKLIMGNNIFVK